MGKDLFDFEIEESPKKEEKKAFKDELHKAEVLCIRGQYDKSLKIYESILDEDIDNQDAYLGILRVHSEDFTLFDGKDIENDIKVIEKLFEDIDNPDYLAYMKKRNVYLKEKKPAPKPVYSESNVIREEPIINSAPAPKKVIDPKYIPIHADLKNKLLAVLNLSKDEADELIAEAFMKLKKDWPDKFQSVSNLFVALDQSKEIDVDDINLTSIFIPSNKITRIIFNLLIYHYPRSFGKLQYFDRARAASNICSDVLKDYGWFYAFSQTRNIDQAKLNSALKVYIDEGLKYVKQSRDKEYYNGPGVPSALDHIEKELKQFKEQIS